MYNTILVPLDGSKRAEAILPHVENLAECYGAKVVLMEVFEPQPLIVEPEPIPAKKPDSHVYERRVHDIEAYLEGLQEKFRNKGIEVETKVGQGPVVETVIHIAEKINASLIAMASHGRTGLARAFYGSVAAGILHRVDRPLLLVRALDDEA